MKGYKSKVITSISIVFLFSIVGLASTTYAWKDLRTVTCPDPGDGMQVAENGDVVTTDHWNQTWCSINDIYGIVNDWPRFKTYFVGMQKDSEGKRVVTEINLPSSSSFVRGQDGKA